MKVGKTMKRKNNMKRMTAFLLPLFLTGMMLLFSGCSGEIPSNSTDEQPGGGNVAADFQNDTENGSSKVKAAGGSLQLASPSGPAAVTPDSIPQYTGEPFAVINGNVPSFSESDFTDLSFETYSELDSLGRCGVAYANVGTDLMPTEKRESIGQIKPSGWQTVKYDNVDGKYLYNRCHLIGYQLTAENANRQNLITGTRYFNVEGMLPFENMAADYVKETGGHVLYRVTPIFEGNNLVASGVQMEACSVEDGGEEVCFNVFVFNVQPGISIDYATGNSWLTDGEESQSSPSLQNSGASYSEVSQGSDVSQTEGVIRGNAKSKIYHCPGQASYDDMADSKYLVTFNTEQEAQDAGYRKAKK